MSLPREPINATPDGASWITLSDVEPERVEWLQPRRLALGKLSLLDGDPGLGKGLVLMSLFAAITTGGELPGLGSFGPADVILMSSEDGIADTLRPRLDAAGGDPARVHLLEFVRCRGVKLFPSLKRDMAALEEGVMKWGARFIGIDPFMGFLGVKDAHKDADVKETLGPFAQMLDRLKVAALGIRHLNKSQVAASLYRGGGSIGIIGAARSAYLLAQDPDDEGRLIVAATKANLCAKPPSLAFRIAGTPNGAARAVWEPRTNEHTADALLQGALDKQGSKRVGQEAEEWLTGALRSGPRETDELKDEAVNGHGFSWKTVERAKKKLGVAARKKAGAKHGGWTWRLSTDAESRPSDPRTQNIDRLDGLDSLSEPSPQTRQTRQSRNSNKEMTVLSAGAETPLKPPDAETSIQAQPEVPSGTEVSGSSPDCWRCQELDRNRLAGARSSAPCYVCGAARSLPSRNLAMVGGATPALERPALEAVK
jgi:hypothetical protein